MHTYCVSIKNKGKKPFQGWIKTYQFALGSTWVKTVGHRMVSSSLKLVQKIWVQSLVMSDTSQNNPYPLRLHLHHLWNRYWYINWTKSILEPEGMVFKNYFLYKVLYGRKELHLVAPITCDEKSGLSPSVIRENSTMVSASLSSFRLVLSLRELILPLTVEHHHVVPPTSQPLTTVMILLLC